MRFFFIALLILAPLSSVRAEFKVDQTLNYDKAGAEEEETTNKEYRDQYKSYGIKEAVQAGEDYGMALSKGGKTLDAQAQARAAYLPKANSEVSWERQTVNGPIPDTRVSGSSGKCYKRTLLAGGTGQLEEVPCNGSSYQQSGSAYVGTQVLDSSKQDVTKDWRSDGPFPQNQAKVSP